MPSPLSPTASAPLTARLAAAAAALITALVLTACGGSGSTTNASATDDAAAKPTRGGTIEYAHQQEPPCISGGWVEQAYISRQVFDSLVSQVGKGRIVPWIATKWKVSKDQLTWTFDLKPGVKFSDGDALDAEAVKANFDYWLDPKTINGTVAAYIGEYYDSSRAVDATTFQLKLKKPYSPLLSALSQGYFGLHSPSSLKQPADVQCVKPVGSGPFVIEKWNRGQNVEFVRNPTYNSAPQNAKNQGPAYVDRLNWKFVKEPATRWGSLTTGQNQVIYDIPSVDWQEAKAEYQVEKYTTPGRPQTLSLNVTKAPFDDIRVRKALAYALDRKAAVENAFGEAADFNGNPALSKSTPNYDASLENAYTYDPDKANALLDQAGWSTKNADGIRTKGGRPLKAVIDYGAGSIINADGATLLQTLQEQAKQVGFEIELKPLTLTQLFGGQFSTPTSYDARPGYWTSPTAGVLYIVWRQNLKDRPNGNNTSFYNDPGLERTIGEANSTLDPQEQQALYSKAQKRISDQAAAIGLYTRTSSLAIDRSKLRDVWLESSQGEPVFSDAWLVKP
ncbi:ABC transporter substrate-binding protein [Patulibacter sp.]|uniref:ABC transporter substrate-binding protein n=1 Tax=Patulibacter sp. TaxID=1912859 RepID=UPI0027237F88|nr:ABC transporter substrate-binding protein [Patulibacter sp.]MDO9407430.1 ABC transporter substrate-binding protein [Patulibacter sp.]